MCYSSELILTHWELIKYIALEATFLAGFMRRWVERIREKPLFLQLLFSQRESSFCILLYCFTNACSRFIFAIVFLLNLFLITAGSSGAVPFGGPLSAYLPHYMLTSTYRHIASHHCPLVRNLRSSVCGRILLWFKAWCMYLKPVIPRTSRLS